MPGVGTGAELQASFLIYRSFFKSQRALGVEAQSKGYLSN